MKRLIYLGYYIKQTDWTKYKKFVSFVHKEYKVSKLQLFIGPFFSSLRYNISLLEYFMFRFWDKNVAQRKEWAGTGFMYEYQLRMNSMQSRDMLLNKAKFLENNKQFINHRWLLVENENFETLRIFLKEINGKVVLKNVAGNCGIGVQVVDSANLDVDDIITLAKAQNLTLAEEYIYQHKDLMRLSPSGLNTIRIFTQIVDDKVVILGTRLRISINSNVDNLAAGNMAAAIDDKTGVITLPAIYSDITKQPETIHPVTGVNVVGFQIPFWTEVIKKVKAIALHNKQNRSVGWDIAVTDAGVDFIEGNHDWCKLVYQLPVGKGLKNELKKYV